MKFLFIVIMGLSCPKLSRAQFVIVSDTSLTYFQLKKFYLEGLKDTVNYRMPLIYHENILDSSNTKFGIFIFRPLTSNSLQQLYLKNFGCDTIEIIRQYNVEQLLDKVFNYFKINNSQISYPQKLEGIKKIVVMLQQRIR
jgi:hypothetical protein